MVFDILLNNAKSALDVTVKVTIKNYLSKKTIAILPSRSLKGFGGDASYSPSWASGSTKAGDYFADIGLYDTKGNLLYNKQFEFSIYQ